MVTQHQICPSYYASRSRAHHRVPLSWSDSQLFQGGLVGGQKIQAGRCGSVIHMQHGLDVEESYHAREELAIIGESLKMVRESVGDGILSILRVKYTYFTNIFHIFLDFCLVFSLTSRTLILPGMLFSMVVSRQCLRAGLSNRPCTRLSCSRHVLSFSTICSSSDRRFPFISRPHSRPSSRTRLGSEGSGLGRGLSDSPCSPGMESLTPWGANFRCSLKIKPGGREWDKEIGHVQRIHRGRGYKKDNGLIIKIWLLILVLGLVVLCISLS